MTTTAPDDLLHELPYFPSADTELRRHAVRAYVTGNLTGPTMLAQRLGEQQFDLAQWRRIMDDIGVGGLLLPESLGGLALGYEDFSVCVEELGRGLLAAPVLGSLALSLGALLPLVGGAAASAQAAAETTATAADGPAAQLATGIAAGRTVAALAFADAAGDAHADPPVAVATGDGYTLRGHSELVVNGPQADAFLVFADIDGAPALLRVDASAVVVTAHPSLDPSCPVAAVTFDDAPGVLLATGDAAHAALEGALRLARIAAAALSVGGAESALDETVAYALARHQFGRPIAAFQAVKHMCADSLLAIQQARAVLSYAVWALDDGSPEAPRALLAAKIAATDAYVLAAGNGVQIHGAMGTTLEMAVQVHFRRARFLSLLLGSNDHDREQLARQLGLGQ